MGEGKRALHVRTMAEVHSDQELPVLAVPPVPEEGRASTQSELEMRVEGAEKLGEVGRLLESSLT